MINENIEILTNQRGYRGNSLLKGKDAKIEWTPELVQEYLKCSKDPIYFCKNYVSIINVDRGLMNFETYGYQDDMINSMNDNRFTIIATARQVGKSFLILIKPLPYSPIKVVLPERFWVR